MPDGSKTDSNLGCDCRLRSCPDVVAVVDVADVVAGDGVVVAAVAVGATFRSRNFSTTKSDLGTKIFGRGSSPRNLCRSRKKFRLRPRHRAAS